jgi:hypothetical protein
LAIVSLLITASHYHYLLAIVSLRIMASDYHLSFGPVEIQWPKDRW